MNRLEVRELAYFVALADEMHFGRAAQHLHIAQPALSKAIAAMEEKLGVQLVARTTRSVSLTAAGQALYQPARAVISSVEAAENAALRAGRESLIVAAEAADAPLARRLLEHHRVLSPSSDPGTVLVGGWGQAVERLRRGAADVALARDAKDIGGLAVTVLAEEPRGVLLSRDHRLSQRQRLGLRELASEPRVTWPAADSQTAAFWLGYESDTQLAQAPASELGPPVANLDELVEVVALGQAIAFLPMSTAGRVLRSDVCLRPVDGLASTRTELIARQPPHPAAVRAFLKASATFSDGVRHLRTAAPSV